MSSNTGTESHAGHADEGASAIITARMELSVAAFTTAHRNSREKGRYGHGHTYKMRLCP